MGTIAKRTTIFDDATGKVIRDSVKFGTQNGDGWVIIYRSALANLAIDAPLVALKVFLALSSMQEFDRGIKITKKALADEFNISYNNVIRGFNWLKANNYVKEYKVNGQTEFLLNPDVTTCGKQKEKKVELWNSIGVTNS